jgi:hypothetical protein
MLKYLFVVCQLWSDDPVMKRVEVIKPLTVCDRDGNVRCSDGYLVVFSGEKAARPVRETDCLYVTEENKGSIRYEE